MQVQPGSRRKLAATAVWVLTLIASSSAVQAQTQTLGADASSLERRQEAEPGFVDRLFGLLGFSDSQGEAIAGTRMPPATATLGADAELPVRPVELFHLTELRQQQARQFFGRVVARETADLAFPLSGTLARFPVEEGAVVEAGTVLAALDLAPFERAVERAEIELAKAERAFARAEALEDRNVGPRTLAEDTESVRDLADVALREARDALDDATITAPYRALIAQRMTANHIIVSPGTPIVRVHDISQMRVEIDVPERLVQKVPLIDRVSFRATLPGQDTPVDLTLVEFEAETAAIGQSYRFTLALPDVPVPNLFPGSSLTVTASIPLSEPAPIVPPTAIVAGNDGRPFVMAFTPHESGAGGAGDGTVRAVPVTVTTVNGTSFAVDGLPMDAEIVGAGAHLLRDGQAVRRFTGLKVGG